MATTLAQLESLSYDILREEESSTAYPSSLMDSLLNYAQNSVCSGNIEDPVTKTQIVKGPLPFLFKNQFYSSVQDTYLDGVPTAGAATLTVSSTADFASSGYLWVKGNIIQYSGKTSTTFTGISASTYPIAFAFEGGTPVSQLFALPSDFAQSVQVVYDGKFQIFPQDYRSLYKDLNDNKDERRYGYFDWNFPFDVSQQFRPVYCIVDGTFFLPMNLNVTGKSLWMQYEKKPTTMTDSVDATIPDDWAPHILPFVAVAEMLYERGEEERASRLLSRACGKIRTMYDAYSQMNSESPYGNRVRTGKDNGLLL